MISCLEELVHASPAEWNRDTRSEAHSFLLALSQFSFIVTLVITQRILAYTRGLSVKLQGRYIDAVRAHTDIESVKSVLKGSRSRVDDFHERLYDDTVQLGANVGVEESVPRLPGRQQHRHNNPATNSKDYYRVNLTIPLLDHMIGELDNRFDSDSSAVVAEFIKLLPAALYNKSASEKLTADDFSQVLELYEDDLPSSRSLDVELDLWQAT